MRFLLPISAVVSLLGLVSCGSTGGGLSPAGAAQVAARQAQIDSEAPGDYWIGRRCHIEKTHLWGYLRRPRQSWDKSLLVVMSERAMRQPDRYPESERSEQRYGMDHNWEYRLWGGFSGRRVYDPNSNLKLPEFVLTRYEVINKSPGWLFRPGERFTGNQLLRHEEGATP